MKRKLRVCVSHFVCVLSLLLCWFLSTPGSTYAQTAWTKVNNAVPPNSNTTSIDGRIPRGTSGGDSAHALCAAVIKIDGEYKMWYSGHNGSNWRIFHATSTNGLDWVKVNNATTGLDGHNTGMVRTDGRIGLGGAGSGDANGVLRPWVLHDGEMYWMWYQGLTADNNNRIYLATSHDGLAWTKVDNAIPAASNTESSGGRIPLGASGRGDQTHIGRATVIKDGDTFKMWYGGHNGSNWRGYYATSTNGLDWVKINNVAEAASNTTGTDGRIPLGTGAGRGDLSHIYLLGVIRDDNVYRMWYTGHDGTWNSIYYATSTNGLTWTKVNNIKPDATDTGPAGDGRIPMGISGGDANYLLSGSVLRDGPTFKLWYTGYDGSSVARIYMATAPADHPTISNVTAEQIEPTTADLVGHLASIGGAPATVRVYYGTNDAAFAAADWQHNALLGEIPVGVWTNTVAGLSMLTPYYYRFYATNDYGEDWADTVGTFFTPTNTLTVAALPVSELGAQSATLNGHLQGSAGVGNPDLYFCLGPNDQGTTTGAWNRVIVMGSAWAPGETFHTNLTDLTFGSAYTYRCFATNDVGEFAWSEPVGFTTVDLPAVDNDGMAWARRREAKVQGTLQSDGGESSLVWVEYWPDGSAVTSTATVGTFSAQAFEATVSGLDGATTYHFRFGASNDAGTVWSGTDNVTTLTDSPINWYVATNGLATAGTEWDTAFQDLAAALSAAESGDTIYMAGHTFWQDSAATLTSRSDLSIYGSYAATNAIDQPGPWNAAQWPTVLRRDPAVRTRLIDITSSTNLYLRGLVFQGGHPNNNQGGGLFISGANGLTFEACRWYDNLAQKIVDHSAGSGGAAHIVNSDDIRFLDCRFDANHTLGDSHHSRGLGGGLYLANSSVSVSNSVFSANRARTTGGNSSFAYGYGGGIYLASGTLDVFRSVIHSNDTMSATGSGGMPTRGGGLYVAGGTARLENVLVATNATRSNNAQGCGLHLAGGTLHLLNVTVADNLREGIRRVAGTLTITNSILWHNGVKDILNQQNDFVSFTGVETGKSDPAIAHGWQGCLTNTPMFFDRTYYHLASEHGVYQDGYFTDGSWTTALETSPLIDAGDPSMPVLHELPPHGGLINLGAYGNTPVASKSAPMQVQNLPLTPWDETSVILNAKVENVDSPPLQARFYYGLSNGGTDAGAWDAYWDAGVVPGWPWEIAARIGGLTPGSNYFVTCRIVNDVGTHVWGTPLIMFTTEKMLPIVRNVGVLNDQGPSVTLQAEIVRPGSASPPPDTWFVWGPEPGEQTVGDWLNQVAMGAQTGAFETVVSTQPGSNYWFTSYAVNSEGTNWAPAAIPFGHNVVRFVDTSATGNGSGYNWSNAFTRLQTALAACVNDRTNVLYLKGGDGGVFRSSGFDPVVVTAAHVRVLGGYAGTAPNGPGPYDPAQWPTVLTRESSVELVRPLLINGATDFVLRDLTMVDGDTRGSGGGGLRIQSSQSVWVDACRIVSNRAVIAADHTAGIGGGVYIVGSSDVRLTDSLIMANETLGNSHHSRGLGGGVYVETSTVAITNVTVANNRARTTGGNASFAYGFGGGIYVHSGALTVDRTMIVSNTTEGGSMPTRGAGVYIAGGTARLHSVLIVTNASTSSAALGSGIHQVGGALTVQNTTVAGNRLEGIHRAAGTVSVTNSIVWGHPSGDLLNFPEDGGVLTTVGWTLIGDGQNDGINDCFNADPLFIDQASGNYRLQTRYGRPGHEPDSWIHDALTSPAIDAGTNLEWHNDALDLDGRPRRGRGLFENQIAIVDMGAYEQTSRPRGSVILMR